MATPLFLYWDVTLASFEVRKFTKLISYQLSNFYRVSKFAITLFVGVHVKACMSKSS